MGAFFVFFLVLILIIIFSALSIVGSILGGIFKFFGIGSNKRGNFSNKDSVKDDMKQGTRQSKEGARRMRKFKNAAEDADYEVMSDK